MGIVKQDAVEELLRLIPIDKETGRSICAKLTVKEITNLKHAIEGRLMSTRSTYL